MNPSPLTPSPSATTISQPTETPVPTTEPPNAYVIDATSFPIDQSLANPLPSTPSPSRTSTPWPMGIPVPTAQYPMTVAPAQVTTTNPSPKPLSATSQPILGAIPVTQEPSLAVTSSGRTTAPPTSVPTASREEGKGCPNYTKSCGVCRCWGVVPPGQETNHAPIMLAPFRVFFACVPREIERKCVCRYLVFTRQ